MKRFSPATSPGTRHKRRKKLLAFGEFVKTAREAKIASQQKAADLFTKHGLEVSQSWVAQLEKGRLTDPDTEVLRKIEAVYGIDYDQLVYALIRDKYRLDDRAFVTPVSRQRWQAAQALLKPFPTVGSVPGLEEDQLRAKSALLSEEVLDPEGLAAWQSLFPNLR